MLPAPTPRTIEVQNGEITLRVAVAGEGPLVLCVHGWPELASSWRHQVAHLSARGYTVAALDVRGYGGSSKPEAIAAYTLRELSGDVLAVAAALSDAPVVLVGHDWGAPIVHTTALLAPDRVRAVASLSVPYMPTGEVMILDVFRQIYAGRFFYQLYFQEEGPIEAEIEADVGAALRKIYFGASGQGAGAFTDDKPAGARFLDGLVDPEPLPAWLTAEEVEACARAFEAGGLRGPMNRYRAQPIDHEELAALRGARLTQPACFIAGAADPVRRFIPGLDLYAPAALAGYADLRARTILDGVGHWVQQEAPAATNEALERFLAEL
ncbi:MAG: alpha/beta hydrolase [Nannocystaceae bacterium]